MQIVIVQGRSRIPIESDLEQRQKYSAKDSDNHSLGLSFGKYAAAPHEDRKLRGKRSSDFADVFYFKLGTFKPIAFTLNFLLLLFLVAFVEQ